MMRLYGASEWLSLVAGTVLLVVTGPPVGLIIGSTVVWEAIDRGFRGGLVESGCELSGVLLGRVLPWLTRLTTPFNKRFVKNEEDAFLVNAALFYGLGLPLLLRTFGRYHLAAQAAGAEESVSLAMCFVYHVLRIGPFFMNFAYVYSVCHKEGHQCAARSGLFAPPFDKRGPFRYIFNWWVGLYYGVMPASFAIGHSVNHHRYNNGPADVVSTSDKPRDDPVALLCYIPRMFLYACNISTVIQ